MNHYRHSFNIAADNATVYAALTSAAGLRGWWSQDCDVASGVGANLHFRFGPNFKSMRIEGLEANREVRWLCTQAHIAAGRLKRRDEWVGTHLVFRLTPAGDAGTRVDFEHIGLEPALECYDLCTNSWDYYLSSLRQFAESGRGTPYELPAASAA